MKSRFFIGLLLALGASRASALSIGPKGPTYEALVKINEASYSGNPADLADSQAKAYDNAAQPPSRLKTIGDTILDDGAGPWNTGMKFVDWYSDTLVEPVTKPIERFRDETDQDGKHKHNFAVRRLADAGEFFYVLPHLFVLLPAFILSAVAAGVGALVGVFHGLKKAASRES